MKNAAFWKSPTATTDFTGSSTYTSLSGVKKEMRIALPVQLAFAGIAFILIIADRLF